MDQFINSVIYIISAASLLFIFSFAYIMITPWDEINLIKSGNTSVALTLSGVIFAMSLSIGSTIYHSKSLSEMIVWGLFACFVQLLIALCMKTMNQFNNTAVGILSMMLSISIGIIISLSIS